MTLELPEESLSANGKVYVTRSVNKYLPAHRRADGVVLAPHTTTRIGFYGAYEFETRWSVRGVCPETFISD